MASLTRMMGRPFLRLTMAECLPLPPPLHRPVPRPCRRRPHHRLALTTTAFTSSSLALTAASLPSTTVSATSVSAVSVSLVLLMILSEPACRLDDTCLGKGVHNPTGDRAPGGPRLAVRPRRPPGYLPLRGVSSG